MSVRIKSDHRITKSHVNRELILAIRERDMTYALLNLYPENQIIAQLYNDLHDYVDSTNEKLKAAYERERIESATGDARKTWKLYKEVIFNQTQNKQNSSVTINGIKQDDSWNVINEYFCSAGEKLATSINLLNGYTVNDIDNLYPENSNNNF